MSAPNAPNERLKVTIYILDRNLRADGLKVVVFRQTRAAGGAWTDAAANPDTAPSWKTRSSPARANLRLASLESAKPKSRAVSLPAPHGLAKPRIEEA